MKESVGVVDEVITERDVSGLSFPEGRYIELRCSGGRCWRKPLLWFPLLATLEADELRHYVLYEECVCWPAIECYLTYNELALTERSVTPNDLSRMLECLPEVDLCRLSREVNWQYAYREEFLEYAYGLATPPDALVQAVREHLHELGRRCRDVAERIRD